MSEERIGEEELIGLRDADVFSPAPAKRLRQLDGRVQAGEPTKEEVVADAIEERLSRAALVDGLTDLPNRRSFLEHHEVAMARSDRARR